MGARPTATAPIFKAGLAALLLLTAACSDAQTSEATLIAKLETLAARGNGEAVYHLAMAHHLGMGIPQDKAKALAEFRRAAELGDPLGAYKLGCYYDGQGEGLVQNDAALALKHKLVAAQAGYALAQTDVASLYARAGDMMQARSWLERAAKQGWSDAFMGMASVNNGENGLPRDPVLVAAYFRLFLDREGGGADQAKWLADYEAKMTPEERGKAAEIVRGYRPAPTALTLKGLSGARAAEALVASQP